MLNLRSLLTRRASGPATTIFGQSTGGDPDVLTELEAIIWSQLGRAGIPSDCVGVEVCALEEKRQKKPCLIGKLHLAGWQRKPVLRLMLGLPVLEVRVRQGFESSWLNDVSTFGGLWLRGFGELQSQAALHELRQAIAQIEAPSDLVTVPDALWSVPAERP